MDSEDCGWLTESAFRRLEVVCSSLVIIANEVSTAGSGNAGTPRLTESAFRRLEVARVPLGYISTKYYPPGRETLASGGFGGAGAPHFRPKIDKKMIKFQHDF